jgi:serine/threonine-protein kinase
MHGTDGKLAGFFSLGEKMSEIPYTGRDKQLLETLANQIALVHENLSLKDRVRREQQIKTEVLSRFDEGNINLLKECPRCGRCYDRNGEKCEADNSELIFTLPVERTIENRYRLEKLIGKGGMGAVYEATDLRINRTVALKILSGASFGNREALRRFEREAQTAGRLQHRNVVTIFDYGTLSTEGAFLVMELVPGESLKEVLKREGKLNLKTIGDWFSQILNGVEAAHKAGIIHRDLKPDNVLVSHTEAGEARLCILDFGLAKLSEKELAGVTTPGTIMGTFGYMPPEQLRGEQTDERSDLFAVGVIIYEALHGEKPFRGRSYQELVRAMNDELVLQPDEPLTEFFEKALAREPENRFVSASAMKNNLTRAIADLQN